MSCIKFSRTEIQIDHRTLARWLDLGLINKKKDSHQVNFFVSAILFGALGTVTGETEDHKKNRDNISDRLENLDVS